MNHGYVKLYRKVMDSFVWTNPNMYKLWSLCLMKASHESRKFLFNGKEIWLNSGEFVTGRDAITFEMNRGVKSEHQVNSTSVWRWLKKFESEQMLNIKSTTKYSVISINNWEEYQGGEQQVNINRTTSEQQVNTNKNEKNEKNDKNNNPRNKRKKRVYADDDPNKILAKTLYKLIQKNQDIKEPDIDAWANTIRLTIESDKRTGKEVQDVIVWAMQDDFWYKVVLSPSSLRRNFDQMVAQMNSKSSSSKKTLREETLPEWAKEPIDYGNKKTEVTEEDLRRFLADAGDEEGF